MKITNYYLHLNKQGSHDEKAIVNSILIKLLPLYKQIITRNLPTDLTVIDKLFESISVTLSSSISNTDPQDGNESIEPYLNDLIGMFYALNENSWRRYAFETCRQVNSHFSQVYLPYFWKNKPF